MKCPRCKIGVLQGGGAYCPDCGYGRTPRPAVEIKPSNRKNRGDALFRRWNRMLGGMRGARIDSMTVPDDHPKD